MVLSVEVADFLPRVWIGILQVGRYASLTQNRHISFILQPGDSGHLPGSTARDGLPA